MRLPAQRLLPPPQDHDRQTRRSCATPFRRLRTRCAAARAVLRSAGCANLRYAGATAAVRRAARRGDSAAAAKHLGGSGGRTLDPQRRRVRLAVLVPECLRSPRYRVRISATRAHGVAPQPSRIDAGDSGSAAANLPSPGDPARTPAATIVVGSGDIGGGSLTRLGGGRRFGPTDRSAHSRVDPRRSSPGKSVRRYIRPDGVRRFALAAAALGYGSGARNCAT